MEIADILLKGRIMAVTRFFGKNGTCRICPMPNGGMRVKVCSYMAVPKL